MNIILKIFKNIYIRLFFLGPKFISSIIFVPFLYLCGWLLATPIFLFGVNKDSISLIGTIFTFLIFVCSLPKWFEIRWGLENTWKLLGVRRKDRNRSLLFYFLRGFLQFSMRRREFSKLQMNGCSDIKKAYLNNFPDALEYVKRHRSFLIKNKCSGFF